MSENRTDDYAQRLARSLFAKAMHRHTDPNLTGPWQQDTGKYAFDVELCDGDDLPTGLMARVVVTVTGS